jgi:Glyoxalase/Bleomycin resistance protein/Dioxygenase superfamily
MHYAAVYAERSKPGEAAQRTTMPFVALPDPELGPNGGICSMNLNARYGDLFQMSYITRDLEAALEHCRRELGLAAFHVSDSEVDVISGGRVQRLAVRAAIANIGRRQFEIIQPVSGPIEVYTGAVDLDSHILNFHHIAIAVRGSLMNWEKLLEEIRAGGDEIAFEFPAKLGPEAMVCFCYVDTRKRLGHYTEYLWWAPQLDGMPSFPNLNA